MSPRPRGSARPDASDAWLELSVSADPEAVEAVSEILSRVATGGITVEPAFEVVEEGLSATLDPSRPATVRGYVPARDEASARDAVQTVETALGHLRAFDLRPIGGLSARLVHEADWAEAWKAHFPVLRIGRRLVIRPTWLAHDAGPDDVVVALDPGMAFGTGLHPTTRLCLAALEEAVHAGARVLDVGCGSGILAIAALKLGAGRAVGLDTDPIAVEASGANARRNRVGRRFDVRRGSLPVPDGPFDLVVANLIASLLVDLAPDLARAVRVGGSLIAGGIFIDREAEVGEALGAAGLDVSARAQEGDWVALTAIRTGRDAVAD